MPILMATVLLTEPLLTPGLAVRRDSTGPRRPSAGIHLPDKYMPMSDTLGWIEERNLSTLVPHGDGFRYAQPILQPIVFS